MVKTLWEFGEMHHLFSDALSGTNKVPVWKESGKFLDFAEKKKSYLLLGKTLIPECLCFPAM